MMNDGVSLADIAAVTKDNDGEGLGNGSWVWVIFLFFLMGWGRNGYGNGTGEAVTESGLCNAMNFNNLENAVGRLSDQNQNQTAQLEASIASFAKENALGQANLQQQISECCCTTQRAIDQVNYNMATNTAAINATTVEQNQRILDKLCAIELAAKDDKIAALQQQINELNLASATNNVVRYPQGFVYNAGNNPFCGCGTSCNTVF